tara:strand:+ start:88 stop:597 length:510 start_codon:yes stop_codon:yes gene_type:complete
MAGQRLTDKAAATNLATDDLLMCVDVSDTTGSAEGTSKKIENKRIIQTDAVAIASFTTLNSSPITLVAAPGAGNVVLPLGCMVFVDYGTTTETNKKSVYVGHTGTAVYYWGFKSGFMHNITTDASYSFSTGGLSAISSLSDLPLKIHSDSNFAFNASATVYISYQILKL